jgi:membrane fusion protein, copper/silver efflux system
VRNEGDIMNRKQQLTFIAAAVATLVAVGAGAYWLGAQHANNTPSAVQASPVQAAPQTTAEGEAATRRHVSAGLKAGDTDPVIGRKILYYQDPMSPAQKFDKPGKSPFMDMMLVPVYADGGSSDSSSVSVSPRIQQNLGLRTAAVTEAMMAPQLTAVGSIAFNERDQAVVQARATGYVEKLNVRATLDRVARGQTLAELYVPDWIAAQEEYLALRRMKAEGIAPLLEGARARMRQAGMSEEQIRQVEASGRTNARMAVTAPTSGLVTELAVREGMTVMPGATLFRINGFSSVWANAEVPESQAAQLRPGARVKATTPAAPDAVFEGRVQALLPEVNATTRTLKARVELANPQGALVPGMFVSLQVVDPQAHKVLQVPSEALIQTGKRTVVMLAEDNGRFRPVEVEAGVESGGNTEVRSGLQAGQRVVVSSQFLIDSEASLRGLEARLNQGTAPAPTAAASAVHQGEGKIEGVAPDAITITHGPIASLKWDSMTMEFKPPPANAMPRNLKLGDRVIFEFTMTPDGGQLTRITPQGSRK